MGEMLSRNWLFVQQPIYVIMNRTHVSENKFLHLEVIRK